MTSEDSIQQAAARIRAGKLVAFPTETVYGLGADPFNSEAVQAIYTLKGRPTNNPLIVHIANTDQIEQVCDLQGYPKIGEQLTFLYRFWPGPLTVVLPKRADLPSIVTGGGDTVGVRIPDHPVARRLIEAAGTPIAAPSANRSSGISPTSAHDVQDEFGGATPFLLDGGPCTLGLESTVVTIDGSGWEILRPGSITEHHLTLALGPLQERTRTSCTSKPLLSPGQLEKHYSPHTPVVFLDTLPHTLEALSLDQRRVGFIEFAGEAPPASFRPTLVRSLPGEDLETAASQLFSTLRELDHQDLDLIVVGSCREEGIGVAIMDRLRRAAA